MLNEMKHDWFLTKPWDGYCQVYECKRCATKARKYGFGKTRWVQSGVMLKHEPNCVLKDFP